MPTPTLQPLMPLPGNRLWLQRNPWFEAELLPVLRALVQQVLAHGRAAAQNGLVTVVEVA